MTQVPRGNDNESNPSVQSMGALVRELRESQGLTLAQLSSKAAVSSGLISQIEHGQGNPAYLTLLKLAQALSVPVGTFFAAPEQKVTNGVVRAGNRRRLEIADKGLVYELLNPSFAGQLFNVIVRIPPGYTNQAVPFDHPVADESMLVMEGQLHVQLGDEGFLLDTGDCITFVTDKAHWFRNPGDIEAVIYCSMTPPVF